SHALGGALSAPRRAPGVGRGTPPTPPYPLGKMAWGRDPRGSHVAYNKNRANVVDNVLHEEGMEDVTRDEDLELALRWTPGTSEDPSGFEAWVRHEGLSAGRSPSVPTVEAYVLYRAWASASGAVPLAPYDFARAMLGRFAKRRTSVVSDRRRV